MKTNLFSHFLVVLTAMFLAGCAWLNKMEPQYTGKPVLQVGDLVQKATTNPVIEAGAAAVPGGSAIMAGLGTAAALAIAAWQSYEHIKDHNTVAAIHAQSAAAKHTDAVVAAVQEAVTAAVQPSLVTAIPPEPGKS